jgi:hypothetical protein
MFYPLHLVLYSCNKVYHPVKYNNRHDTIAKHTRVPELLEGYRISSIPLHESLWWLVDTSHSQKFHSIRVLTVNTILL